jgi:hypothetical protein
MFGTIARIALMRILPRRLIPLLAAWQVISALRGRKGRPTGETTDPSRTPARRR